MKRTVTALMMMFLTAAPPGTPVPASAQTSKSAEEYAAHEGQNEGGGIDVNPFNGSVSLRDFRVKSPEGFTERTMAYLPRITADYDMNSSKEGVQHFTSVRVELGELVLVRRKNGDFNFKSLIEEKPKPAEKKKKTPFRIDQLELKIGRMIYKDYTTGTEPLIVTFKININETYKGVTNDTVDNVAKSLGSAIIKNIGVEDAKNFDIGKLPDIAASAWAAVPESTKAKLLGPEKKAKNDIDKLAKKLLTSIKALEKK